MVFIENTLLENTLPSIFISPRTSNALTGLFVPIPTLPEVWYAFPPPVVKPPLLDIPVIWLPSPKKDVAVTFPLTTILLVVTNPVMAFEN